MFPSFGIERLKQRVSNISLRTVVGVPFIFQMVVTVSLVGYFSYRNGQHAVHDLASQLRNELTARIDQHLQTYIKIPHSINRLNADALSEGEINFITDNGVNQFLQQIKIASFVNSVYCGDHQTGHFIGVSRTPNGGAFQLMISNDATDYKMHLYGLDVRADRMYFLEEVAPYNPRLRPWYRIAQASGQPTWSDIYFDFTTQLPTLTASVPAYSQNGKRFLGVCGSDVLLSEELRQFLQTLEIGQSGEAFIIERSGILVSSSDRSPLTVGTGENIKRLKASESRNFLIRSTAEYLNQYFGQLQSIRRPVQLDFLLQGERQFIQVLPFNDTRGLDWLIVLVLPEADFMERIHTNNRITIILCVIALSIITASSLLTARWISFPILRLSQASQAIAQGQLNQTVEPENIRELSILARSFNTMSQRLQKSFTDLEKANEELENRVELRTAELRQEKEKSEQLLLNILPKAIIERLKQDRSAIASATDEVSILFADIVGFTSISAKIPPIQLVGLLNQIFSHFDELAERYDLEKIKTIGDAYMVVGGLPLPKADHAEAIANLALEMQAVMEKLKADNILADIIQDEHFQIRIGINTGAVVAGVIGTKKFIYDLWGDAVNIASRMESSGKPGRIQVTEATYERLKDQYQFEPRGLIPVKGRGKMKTYWLVGQKF